MTKTPDEFVVTVTLGSTTPPTRKLIILPGSAVPSIAGVLLFVNPPVVVITGCSGTVVSTSIAGTLAGDDGFPAVSVAMTVKL